MMKETPCSSRGRATLKTLGKLSYSHRRGNPAKRVRAWALIGPRRGNIASPLSAEAVRKRLSGDYAGAAGNAAGLLAL